MHKDEGVFERRTADGGADLVEEHLLFEGAGFGEDDMLFGVRAELEVKDGRAFEFASLVGFGDGDVAGAEVEFAACGAVPVELGVRGERGDLHAVGGEEDADDGGVGAKLDEV